MVLLHLSICSSCLFTSLPVTPLCFLTLHSWHGSWHGHRYAPPGSGGAGVAHLDLERRRKTGVHAHTHGFKCKERNAKWIHPVDWSGGFIFSCIQQSLNALTGRFPGSGSGRQVTDLELTYTTHRVKVWPFDAPVWRINAGTGSATWRGCTGERVE